MFCLRHAERLEPPARNGKGGRRGGRRAEICELSGGWSGKRPALSADRLADRNRERSQHNVNGEGCFAGAVL
ncbi:MAG: hypothetical protein MPL62_11350 [Alphaproteobacteria bacterium]|nr:hypothetical protein [Alphaproteobacteria bacterium]